MKKTPWNIASWILIVQAGVAGIISFIISAISDSIEASIPIFGILPILISALLIKRNYHKQFKEYIPSKLRNRITLSYFILTWGLFLLLGIIYFFFILVETKEFNSAIEGILEPGFTGFITAIVSGIIVYLCLDLFAAPEAYSQEELNKKFNKK